jgi:periodic tryptophan protein 2
VVGFSNGLFGLYDLPEFNMVHLLRYVEISSFYGLFSVNFSWFCLVSHKATLML